MKTTQDSNGAVLAPSPCSAVWTPIENPPRAAGQYIVGNTSHGYVGQARWLPRKAEWKFPAAQSAFTPDVWTAFPFLPNNENHECKYESDGGGCGVCGKTASESIIPQTNKTNK
jgi:hypothetical protein